MVLILFLLLFFFFKQKTAYEMRISGWSSDVCSSDLGRVVADDRFVVRRVYRALGPCDRLLAVAEFGQVHRANDQGPAVIWIHLHVAVEVPHRLLQRLFAGLDRKSGV